MKIAILGGHGMLGTDLARLGRARGHQVTALAHDEADVTDARALARALGLIRADAVVNCAAFTDVDGAETSEAEALKVNAEGAGNAASTARVLKARFVHVSSDYVFGFIEGARAAGGNDWYGHGGHLLDQLDVVARHGAVAID